MKAKTAILFFPAAIFENWQHVSAVFAQEIIARDINTLVYNQTGVPNFGAACWAEIKKAIGLDYRGLRDNLPHEEFKRLYMGDWIPPEPESYCPECERARRGQWSKIEGFDVDTVVTRFMEYENLRARLIDDTEPRLYRLTSGDSAP